MAFDPGNRLGAYEITGKLGEGGMGEVYRATDTKLRRDVAIKVLPAAFTEDKERLARFEREAQLLAQLHHPNIASIFGLEESDGTRALVMELVEGPTLAERLEQGPLPFKESLSVSLQIAQALEEAHEKGIIHRDLKPQNIKASMEGKVKVLDFGLAKAMDPTGAAAISPHDLAHSPTVTFGGTREGVILGTAAYMAPEQARGGAVDKRADIWAFGVVLFEMLSGERLFAEGSVVDTLSAVMRKEIDLGRLPLATPPRLRDLVRRCLERNPKNRLHDVADARLELEEVIAGRASAPAAAAPAAPDRSIWRGVAVASAVGLAVGWGVGQMPRLRLGERVAASAISFERLTFRPGNFTSARFAPDGQTVFLAADWDDVRPQVFQVRPKTGELAIGLTGVDLLSVSRAGQLALLLPRFETGQPYTKSGTLAVASASGGTPRELAEHVTLADWAPDGESLAIVRWNEDRRKVEFPIGTLLYETPRRIESMRVSPAGDAVAFFEYEADGTQSVVVVERSGKRQVLSAGWYDWWLLAWSPDGREVWFSAAHSGAAASLFAVDRGGRLRTLLSAPGTLELLDVAPDGAALVAQVDFRAHVFGRRASDSDTGDRDLSWLELSTAFDLSADGRTVLLMGESEREAGVTSVLLRSMDGSPPVHLGSGVPQELSRDGKWALAIRDDGVVALPTAAGKERILQSALRNVSQARFLPDGVHVLLAGTDKEGRSAFSVASFDGEAERELAAPFALRSLWNYNRPLSPVSPDGSLVAAATATGELAVFSLLDGKVRTLPGGGPNDLPTQWTADGRGLFVFDPSGLPGRISRVELLDGRRSLWRELHPHDRFGVSGVAKALITPDGSAFVYSYLEWRSDLYLVKGLR